MNIAYSQNYTQLSLEHYLLIVSLLSQIPLHHDFMVLWYLSFILNCMGSPFCSHLYV